MSNSIRFEFYNNFDIWYDLYQENGGDPNLCINLIMYNLKEEYGLGYGDGYRCGNGYENLDIYGEEYGDEYGNGYGYEYEYGCGCGNGYGYWYGNGHEIKCGILFMNGDGTW